MAEFSREVTVQPAFDCLNVQPCVHGSEACGTDPRKTHGRGTARMRFALYTPTAEVSLTIDTGWMHTATPNDVRARYAPMELMGDLSILCHHASRLIPDCSGAQSEPERCTRAWDTCWSLVNYRSAKLGTALLVEHGTDALWTWLEGRWLDQFEPEADRG